MPAERILFTPWELNKMNFSSGTKQCQLNDLLAKLRRVLGQDTVPEEGCCAVTC